ncbi:MAG: glycosyltransferase family 2 protein [Phycisphaerae bacterium]|nr:glycosyltransferase family 2 protein [Phycisphaerae bacterium]
MISDVRTQSRDREAPDVSIVIPLFNESEVFDALIRRVREALGHLDLSWEVVLVDDGSRDDTAERIRRAAETDPQVRGVILSRNFGHQAALCAGLEHARGRAVITMDGDLQDPPEILLRLVARWREGWQVVHARRRTRKAAWWKRVAYFTFYRIFRWVAPIDVAVDAGDFALMDRCVVDLINAMPERTRFLRGLRSWVGFRQTAVEYDRPDRAAGDSKYSLRALFRLAYDGIISFSDLPLRLVTLMGFLVSAGSLAYACYIVAWRLITGSQLPGFATLIAAIAFLGGMQLIAVGICGEYIARIYREVKRRPVYVVQQCVGRDVASSHSEASPVSACADDRPLPDAALADLVCV